MLEPVRLARRASGLCLAGAALTCYLRRMVNVPRWLFVLCVPVVFFGGCTASVPLVWRALEPAFTAVCDDGHPGLALVVNNQGSYSISEYGRVAGERKIAVDIHPEQLQKINSDLCGMVGLSPDHPYFKIVEVNSDGIHVSLERPTNKDNMWKVWYLIKGGDIIAERELRYGPGFAFLVMTGALGIGAAGLVLFFFFVRIRKPRAEQIPPPPFIVDERWSEPLNLLWFGYITPRKARRELVQWGWDEEEIEEVIRLGTQSPSYWSGEC